MAAVTFFCATAFLAVDALNADPRDRSAGPIVALIAAGAMLGAAVGLLFGRAVVGAMIGVWIVFVGLIIVYLIVLNTFA